MEVTDRLPLIGRHFGVLDLLVRAALHRNEATRRELLISAPQKCRSDSEIKEKGGLMTALATSSDSLTGLGPSDLITLLNGLPHEVDERQSEYNLNLVRRLGEAPCISGLIGGILQDDVLMDEIAGRSYRHVNHFDKIVLVDTGAQLGYRLTLHAWCPPYTEKELKDELIHDHRFSFWSTILTGRLVSQNFARGRTRTRPPRFRGSTSSSTGMSRKSRALPPPRTSTSSSGRPSWR